ncbi:hypothetical protein [Inhella sp.]|uniref:hypothetical protein n=1 Tax=Inhella sp. TaxID=1921806 RepID=UPI0035AE5D10
MIPASPALVAQAGARPLSRWALLLICLAYLLPGQLSREPWRQGDLTSFGFMAALARGESSWWTPTLAGLAAPDGALLPYWLGAGSMLALPMLDTALAARLPFILLLALVLALVWYATFHFARTEAAQPVAFAFGGEANTLDYARALADAALLALIASLGLLRIGHEATSALLQLVGAGLWLYAMAAAPYRDRRAQVLVALGLLILSLSGAPFVALLLALAGLLICQYSRFEGARRLRWGLALGMLTAGAAAFISHAWTWRLDALQAGNLLQLLLWFLWPSGALTLWTLWRWRGHLGFRHIAVPLSLAAVGLLACLSMGGSDRALLVALPGLAVLASFALPTLKRGASAMLDWFSLFFFSAAALFVWAYYLALHTPWFPKLLANVQRQSPGFQAEFEGLALLLAVAGTLAWLTLVRWRSSRQRAALWRSLVLPAGGLVLLWLLFMTLLRPAADRALGHQSLLSQLQLAIPAEADCVAAPGQSLDVLSTLQALGKWRTDGRTPLASSSCSWALLRLPRRVSYQPPEGWEAVRQIERPADRGTWYWVLRRR